MGRLSHHVCPFLLQKAWAAGIGVKEKYLIFTAQQPTGITGASSHCYDDGPSLYHHDMEFDLSFLAKFSYRFQKTGIAWFRFLG